MPPEDHEHFFTALRVYGLQSYHISFKNQIHFQVHLIFPPVILPLPSFFRRLFTSRVPNNEESCCPDRQIPH